MASLKQTLAVCLLIGGLTPVAAHAQQPETHTPIADTYVRSNNNQQNGNSSLLGLKKSSNNGYNRMTAITFQRAPGPVNNAILHLDVAGYNSSDDYQVYRVWGVDNVLNANEHFNESLANWYSFTAFDGYGVDSNSGDLWDSDPSAGGTQSLGTFYIFADDTQAHFSSEALAQFIASDNNSLITLLIEDLTNDSAVNYFASKEHPTLNPPTLEINVPPPVHVAKVNAVDENWKSIGIPTSVINDSTTFAQITTYNGAQAARARIDTAGRVKVQECDDGTHNDEQIDVVAINTDAVANHVPMASGSFTLDVSTDTVTIETEADTYLRANNWGPYGSDTYMHVKRSGTSTTRKGLMRFQRPMMEVSDAVLRLELINYNNGPPNAANYSVWGIADGTDAEHFAEYSVKHHDLPFLDNSSDGTTNDPAYLYGGTPLGTFSADINGIGQDVTFTSDAFVDFVNADQDGVVTVLLTRVESAGLNTSFAQREHATAAPARLELTTVDNLWLVDYGDTFETPVFFADAKTYNGAEPVAVYPAWVGPDRAYVRMAEGMNYDGIHNTETIEWAAFEAGFYDLGVAGFLDVGVEYVQTTDYGGSATMQNITPLGGTFTDDAAVIVHPQSSNRSGWQGTRVIKNLSGGDLQSVDVRFMLDQSIENTDPVTEGWVGWMVIGPAEPFGNPGNIEDWDFEETVTDPADESTGGATSGTGCGGGGLPAEVWWSVGDSFGSNALGAGYLFEAGITDDEPGYDTWTGGRGVLDVTLFETTRDVISVGAQATTVDQYNENELYVCLDLVLYQGCPVEESMNVTYEIAHTATLVEVSAIFFGITVSGAIDGEIGFDITGAPGASGMSFDIEPYVTAAATASAGVGCCGLGASINGSVDVVTVGLPTEANLNLDVVNGDLTWDIDVDFSWSTLFGSIYLAIEAIIVDEEYELFGWEGFTDSLDVFDADGCFDIW